MPGKRVLKLRLKVWRFEKLNKELLDKPLGKWTLQELQEWCNNSCSDCADCPFKSRKTIKCRLGQSIPGLWGLQSKPRWTEQDIQDAKVIKRIFPWADIVLTNGLDLRLFNKEMESEVHTILSRGTLLPSLKKGERIRLCDILESEID